MVQEFIQQNRVRLHRLGTAALVVALVLAIVGGLGGGFTIQSMLFGEYTRLHSDRWSMFIATVSGFLFGTVFPIYFMVGVFGLVRFVTGRGHPAPWIVRHADKAICVYVALNLFFVLHSLLRFRWPVLQEGLPLHEVYWMFYSPIAGLLRVATMVPWAIAAALWRKVIMRLEQLGDDTSTIAEWIERNGEPLLRLANACAVVGLLVLVHAGVYGYAHMARHVERVAEAHEYVRTAAQIAAGFLFHAAVLLGVYGFIHCIVDRKSTVPLLLLHGDRVIYLYIVVAVVNRVMPFWWMVVRPFENSSRSQPFSTWWGLAIMPTFLIVTLLPLVVWAMFAPILKSGAGMMQKQRTACSV